MEDVQAMRRAIELSQRARYSAAPNPDVGCVILDGSGQLVGEGWHRQAGGPHAEVEALIAAGPAARGGTAVVTLEPCAHVGRTGACVDALLQAGVARAVYGVGDPNPLAAGGASRLRDAGVEVVGGVLADDAATATARWLLPYKVARPFVTWKFAASLDGRSAAADGSSRWITGAPAREDVHQLRASVDAIVAGIGTVLADDPALTVRGVAQPQPQMPVQPLRVVLDTHGRTPAEATVLNGEAPTWVATAANTATAADGRLDLMAVLTELFSRDVRSVLLEGGPTVAAAFWQAGLVDRVAAYLAPVLLGEGPAAVADLGLTTIGEAIRLEPESIDVIGTDVRIIATTPTARAIVIEKG